MNTDITEKEQEKYFQRRNSASPFLKGAGGFVTAEDIESAENPEKESCILHKCLPLWY